MTAAFQFYDEEKTGFITTDIFRHCMQDLGPGLDFEELKKGNRPGLKNSDVQEMVKCFDPKGTGKIDYRAFLKEMLGK